VHKTLVQASRVLQTSPSEQTAPCAKQCVAIEFDAHTNRKHESLPVMGPDETLAIPVNQARAVGIARNIGGVGPYGLNEGVVQVGPEISGIGEAG
jgi:hypothetical protein